MIQDSDLNLIKNLTVLYVEDDVDSLKEMKANIDDCFKKFLTACNGQEALEIFEANESDIDLIITDIKMPKLSGIELLKKIRDKKSDVSFIVVTAFSGDDKIQEAIKYGVDSFLVKPIDLNDMFEAISRVSAKVQNKRLKDDLQNMNRNLEKLVQEKVDELRDRDKMILKQSKYALMGEIIDAIAHQWKQPLSTIDMLAFTLTDRFKQKITISYVDEKANSIREQIRHLNNTLSEFRNFFRTDKTTDIFKIKDSFESCKILVKDEFIQEMINLNYVEENSYAINGYFNEFKHVILNLINNSKDAFIENRVVNRVIEIESKVIDSHLTLSISDNGGGIDEGILENIFEPNFTTKESKGTGIGLYICKMVLDKIDAKIDVQNIYMDKKRVGTKFIIRFPSYQL